MFAISYNYGEHSKRNNRKPKWQIFLSAYRLYIAFFGIIIIVGCIILFKNIPHSEKKSDNNTFSSQTAETKAKTEKKQETDTKKTAEKKTVPVTEKKSENKTEDKTNAVTKKTEDNDSSNFFTKSKPDDKSKVTEKKTTEKKSTEKKPKKSIFRRIIDFFKSIFSKKTDSSSAKRQKENITSDNTSSGDNTEKKEETKLPAKTNANKKLKGTYTYGEYATFSFDGKRSGVLTLQDASQYDFEYSVNGDTLSIRFNDDGHIDKYNFVLTEKTLRLNGIGETQGSFVFKK